MVRDSKATGTTWLSCMILEIGGLHDVVFYNAGKDHWMKLAHHRTWHRSVATLKRMYDTNSVDGLDAIVPTKDVDEVWEPWLVGQAKS